MKLLETQLRNKFKQLNIYVPAKQLSLTERLEILDLRLKQIEVQSKT